MSRAALDLLAAFDALPVTERDAVVTELLTRHRAGGDDPSDADLAALADELFLTFDAAEAANAAPAG